MTNRGGWEAKKIAWPWTILCRWNSLNCIYKRDNRLKAKQNNNKKQNEAMEWRSLGWLLMPKVGPGLDSWLMKHLSMPRLCWSRLVHVLRKTHQRPRPPVHRYSCVLLEAVPSTAFGLSASGGCAILATSSRLRPHLRVLGTQVI